MKGHAQWSEQDRRAVAKLYALHLALHPKRLARIFGCSPRYVRVLLSKYVLWELPPEAEALKRLQRVMETQ